MCLLFSSVSEGVRTSWVRHLWCQVLRTSTKRFCVRVSSTSLWWLFTLVKLLIGVTYYFHEYSLTFVPFFFSLPHSCEWWSRILSLHLFYKMVYIIPCYEICVYQVHHGLRWDFCCMLAYVFCNSSILHWRCEVHTSTCIVHAWFLWQYLLVNSLFFSSFFFFQPQNFSSLLICPKTKEHVLNHATD